MAHLFSELQLRSITFKNRIAVSPMCQYSSVDGLANEWHSVHLGSRAIGGAALVFTEAAAVEDIGRISPQDLGIYNDEQVQSLKPITAFISAHRSVPGIQLAHAGRKASTARPWEGGKMVSPENGGWERVIAPSAVAFSDSYPSPVEMSEQDIQAAVQLFADASRRALEAGFQTVEIHGAHGYLIHEFLSPLSNLRVDRYGGSFENRCRFALEVVDAVRAAWPEHLPLFMRISASDWTEGGWTVEDSVSLGRLLREHGIDLVDCSSGGNAAHATIPVGPGYQTAFAEQVKREAAIATGAVGMITSSSQADHIIRSGQADMVLLAREMLRDPYWPRRAAKELGQELAGPVQYGRAW
jgi:2,4-dienoyl-CoA reductase-like NADH-dependent reductase (Old Yellow Enzyme family)